MGDSDGGNDYGGSSYDGGGDLSSGSASSESASSESATSSGGFNAATDSQAANESLGLGPSGDFSGGVNIGGAVYSGGDSGLSFSGVLGGAKKAVGYATDVAAMAFGGPLAIVGGAVNLVGRLSSDNVFDSLSTRSPTSQTSAFQGGDGGGDFAYASPLSFTQKISSPGVAVESPRVIASVSGGGDTLTGGEVKRSEPVTVADVTDPSSGGVATGFDWFKWLGAIAAGIAIYKGVT